MCWPPIGWSFVRGKIQIAMVVGRVCRVVVGEGSFTVSARDRNKLWSANLNIC